MDSENQKPNPSNLFRCTSLKLRYICNDWKKGINLFHIEATYRQNGALWHHRLLMPRWNDCWFDWSRVSLWEKSQKGFQKFMQLIKIFYMAEWQMNCLCGRSSRGNLTTSLYQFSSLQLQTSRYTFHVHRLPRILLFDERTAHFKIPSLRQLYRLAGGCTLCRITNELPFCPIFTRKFNYQFIPVL